MTAAALNVWLGSRQGNVATDMRAALTAALAVSGYRDVMQALEEVRELAVTLIDAVGDDAEQGGTAILMRAKAALARITGDQLAGSDGPKL